MYVTYPTDINGDGVCHGDCRAKKAKSLAQHGPLGLGHIKKYHQAYMIFKVRICFHRSEQPSLQNSQYYPIENLESNYIRVPQ